MSGIVIVPVSLVLLVNTDWQNEETIQGNGNQYPIVSYFAGKLLELNYGSTTCGLFTINGGKLQC